MLPEHLEHDVRTPSKCCPNIWRILFEHLVRDAGTALRLFYVFEQDVSGISIIMIWVFGQHALGVPTACSVCSNNMVHMFRRRTTINKQYTYRFNMYTIL